jgi:hypothetical protein
VRSGPDGFDAGSRRWLVAVVALYNGLTVLPTVSSVRAGEPHATVAFADQVVEVLRPAALHIAHDLLPFVQVFLYQPVNQALDLIFDLLRNVGQNLLFELGPDLVAAHQVLDVGQAHRAVEEVEASLFETVQDVLDFGQAWRKLTVQFALVRCDDGFQGGGGLLVFIQGFGLGCQGSPRLVGQMFSHPQRVVELEQELGGVVEGGADELL